MSGRVATVKQQACAPGLRHGKHQYGVEVFLSHPMRVDTRLARKRHAQYLLMLRGTVMLGL
jgi:hypothetical protein